MANCCGSSSEDFLDDWLGGGGIEVTVRDPEGGEEGRLRLTWAAVLGLVFVVLIFLELGRDR